MALITGDSVFKRFVSTVETYLAYIIGLLIILYAVFQYRAYHFDLQYWDSMLISGLIVLVIGIQLAKKCPVKMNQTLERLQNRDALTISDEEMHDLQTKLKQRVTSISNWTGIFVSFALLLAFVIAYRFQLPAYEWALAFIEAVLGFFAGRYIGRMIAYGGIGRFLKREKVSIRVVPGHLDGAAGLKPIGDMFFFQAMLLALPAFYLAVWWFIIPLWPEGFYDHWRQPYISLLVMAILFEILAFIAPLWIFHQEMQQQKQQLFTQADVLSKQIVDIEHQLSKSSIAEQRKVLNERLEVMKEQYWQIEKMPTWPVDMKTRKRFTLNNVGLFVPVISQLISTTSPWQRILRAMETFFTSLPE